MPPRLLLVLALAAACTRGTAAVAPPQDLPPPEPPPVLADIAPTPDPEPEPEPPPPPAPTLDLAATAREAGDLTTFLAALDTAGLQDTLGGPGPLTVFAPSDQAFAALPKGELDRLRKNKKKLAALLQHHIVAGAVISAESLAQQPPPLGLPADLAAHLQRPDIQAKNGVLHVVDLVLTPQKPGKQPAAQPAPSATPAPDKKPAEQPVPPATPKPDKLPPKPSP